MKIIIVTIACCLSLVYGNIYIGYAQGAGAQGQTQVVGTIFGQPVPLDNFMFIRSGIAVFGNRFGSMPVTQEQWDDAIWEQLVLSYEAYRRNIQVSPEEMDSEIAKFMKANGATLDWKKDKDAYARFIKEKINEPVDLFENQIKHLYQLQKLRTQITDSMMPEVTDAQAHQEFLNENSKLSLEVAHFGDERTTRDFYAAVSKDAKIWDEAKRVNPANFSQSALMPCTDILKSWQMPQDDLNAMMKLKDGDVYPATVIYAGWAAFKILAKSEAPESNYAAQKDKYFQQVVTLKKNAALDDWFKKLQLEARITIYKQGG